MGIQPGPGPTLDAGVPVPYTRAQDPAKLPLCPWHASALELGIASPGTVTTCARGSSPAWRSRCLLYPQSPVLLASLGVGLVTLLGLAVGSYLVTLLDPNEKYLLRLLDKTVR
ncbi:hypothetical protein P7K49_035704 [Saguinus oedipus]|uniref:Uncharacterized protein n=1 Tax=Saguinus oedipus TaxID=9490 RepID=A0ABQ9TND8_SAGOE|nr:hypothetical protein P7K49_035704 [Saguinus oedipus]